MSESGCLPCVDGREQYSWIFGVDLPWLDESVVEDFVPALLLLSNLTLRHQVCSAGELAKTFGTLQENKVC